MFSPQRRVYGRVAQLVERGARGVARSFRGQRFESVPFPQDNVMNFLTYLFEHFSRSGGIRASSSVGRISHRAWL